MSTKFNELNRFAGVQVVHVEIDMESPASAFFSGRFALELDDGMRIKSAYPRQNWGTDVKEAMIHLVGLMEAELVRDFSLGDFPSRTSSEGGGGNDEEGLTFPG